MAVTAGIWLPEQYEGEVELTVRVAQLASDGVVKRSQEPQIELDWLAFFSTASTNILDLTIWSRVKQSIVDSLSGQSQLKKLTLK